MSIRQISGVTAVILGAVLLGFSYNAADTPIGQVTDVLSGRHNYKITSYLILGITAVVCGGVLTFFGKRTT